MPMTCREEGLYGSLQVLKGNAGMQALVGLMMEEDKDTLVACWTALGAVINSIPKELQPSYVRTMREAVQVLTRTRLLLTSCELNGWPALVAIRIGTSDICVRFQDWLWFIQTARDKERRKRKPGPLLLAGFCLPKALQPVLPIYLQGMLQASQSPCMCQITQHLVALQGCWCCDPLQK